MVDFPFYRIVFCQKAYAKFLSLDLKSRQRFLKALNNNQAIQHSSLVGLPHGFIRIRFNLFLRIIVRLVKLEKNLAMIVLDFVNHDQMDRGLFNIHINGNLIDINDIPESDIQDDSISVTSLIQINEIWLNQNLKNDIIADEINEKPLFFSIRDKNNFFETGVMFSEEQYHLIQGGLVNHMSPSILLEGGAGSGKTSVAICQALQHPNYHKIAYITYNQYLVDYTKKIAKELCQQKIPSNLYISSFINLLQKILGDSEKKQFSPGLRITKARFLNEWKGSRRLASIVWREIQQHIKGSLKAIDKPNKLISLEDYMQCGEEIEPDINREDIYREAERYQLNNEAKNYWDDLDLSIAILRIFNQNKILHLWDILYCDEAQDFTEIQLYLLLRFTKPRHNEPPAFFITGDPSQILNPSGFSWKRIKTILWHLREEYKENWSLDAYNEPKQFSLNFRSQADIVNLSNQVNRLRNLSAKPLFPFKIELGKPLVIYSSIKEVLRDRDVFGPWNAIIVANPQEENIVINQFSTNEIKSQRVFGITDVKGLEFQQVLVLDFFTTFHQWQNQNKLQAQGLLDYIENCLYVCITRAEQQLIFIESKECIYWNKQEIKNYIQSGNLRDFTKQIEQFFSTESKEDWINSAKEYEEKGQYAIAQENYSRGGDSINALRMKALLYEEEAQWQLAGNIWQELRQWDKALENYSKIELQSEAVINCQAEIYEILGEKEQNIDHYCQAAKLWQTIFQWQKATIAWDNIGEYGKAAQCQEKLENYWEAAQYYLRLHQYEKAAQVLEKGNYYQESAECYRKFNQFNKAENLLNKNKKIEFEKSKIEIIEKRINTNQNHIKSSIMKYNNLNQLLKNAKSLDSLSENLEIPKKFIESLIHPTFCFKYYDIFYVPRKQGKPRQIEAPLSPLIDTQWKLKNLIESQFNLSPYAYGYVKNRSCIDNARYHLGCNSLLNLDISDFFRSIRDYMIFELFKKSALTISDDLALWLTVIVSIPSQLQLKFDRNIFNFSSYEDSISDIIHAFHNHETFIDARFPVYRYLPHGSPCSPILSNLIFKNFDDVFADICHSYGCKYSRYVDDITISSTNNSIPSEILDSVLITGKRKFKKFKINQDIFNLLTENGFQINWKKFQYSEKNDRKIVNGIILGRTLKLSSNFIRELSAILIGCQKYGLTAVARQLNEKNSLFISKKYHTNVQQAKKRLPNDYLIFEDYPIYGLLSERWTELEISLDNTIRGKLSYVKSVYGERSKIYKYLSEMYKKISK